MAANAEHFIQSNQQSVLFGRNAEDSLENLELGTRARIPNSVGTNLASFTAAKKQQQQQQAQEHQQQRKDNLNHPLRGVRASSKRNYELFPGNNIFFLGGRFLTGRAYWAFAISLFLILAPSALFAAFTQVLQYPFRREKHMCS